jgi:hypothetical protein
MGDVFWEETHDFIQWLFPLPEPSRAVPSSPVATREDFLELESNPFLRMRSTVATARFLTFLDNTQKWRCASDHNHLRITRALRSLRLSGRFELSETLYLFVKDVLKDVVVLDSNMKHWDSALGVDSARHISELVWKRTYNG